MALSTRISDRTTPQETTMGRMLKASTSSEFLGANTKRGKTWRPASRHQRRDAPNRGAILKALPKWRERQTAHCKLGEYPGIGQIDT
jgi:hypothetical protein